MSRNAVWISLVLANLAVPSLFAATYAVGTCKRGLSSYPTISAAVAGVPAGSTILVCPGTYSEQIVISQPLTLQGVSSRNVHRTVITAPGSGLNTSTADNTVSAQVEVDAGPVNLTNLTVDGTGSAESGQYLVGIFYSSTGSGTVNEVTARHQTTATATGMAIYAENISGVSTTVTVKNSSLHDFDLNGIQLVGSLNGVIEGNFISSKSGTLTSGIYGGAAFNVYTMRAILPS